MISFGQLDTKKSHGQKVGQKTTVSRLRLTHRGDHHSREGFATCISNRCHRLLMLLSFIIVQHLFYISLW